jgi:Protein of unknown function (DUF2726)
MSKTLELPLTLVCILIAVAIVLNILKALFSGKKAGDTNFPYETISHLFTPAERSFLGMLDHVISSDYRVFGKVRAADVIKVSKLKDRSAWQQAFNRIQSKHFDFVICRASDSAILLLIELDDKSHSNDSRMKRDAFVEKVTEAAGLPLLRIRCQKSYSPSEITSLLKPHLPNIDTAKV